MAQFLMNFREALTRAFNNSAHMLMNNRNSPSANNTVPKPANEYVVDWTPSAFPSDGSGKVINVKPNQPIRFLSKDRLKRTVAQAIKIHSSEEASGYMWGKHPDPEVEAPPAQENFNKVLILKQEGNYHFASPVKDTNPPEHEVMRITVKVKGDEELEYYTDDEAIQEEIEEVLREADTDSGTYSDTDSDVEGSKVNH